MADAAVEFLLNNLLELAKYNIDLVKNLEKELGNLTDDLLRFQKFLNNTRKIRRNDTSLQELARQIQVVVYHAEDIIDTFVIQETEKTKTRSRFRRAVTVAPFSLIPIAEDVKSIRSKVDDLEEKMDLASHSVAGGPEEKVEPEVREVNVVGFKDEANTIIRYLNEPTNELDVISIIGMPGLGKTTLAGMVFRDPALEYIFPIRIWVYISQEFTLKDVFLTLLNKLTSTPKDNLNDKTYQQLAKLVANALQSSNFLIVLDDVWSAEDWHGKLELAFPKVTTMGKILITSRKEEVGVVSNHNRAPHKLRSLTVDEGWELLQLEVYGKAESRPEELENWGRVIVKKCAMLPLAIVVSGGYLAKTTSVSDQTSDTIDAWGKFSYKVSEYLTNDDPTKSMEKIIELSYDNLPHHLKSCFLYFGMFPEDFEIPVWKLTRMWIAEGFVQQAMNETLEETAYNYLNELINRNLVRKEQTAQNGKVKTCRIHDMLREYCRTAAGYKRENFLQEIKTSKEGNFYPPIVEKQNYRRLCIHSNVEKFLSSKFQGSHVRSFVCFSKDDVNPENFSTIPPAFKLLRVLEAKPIKLTRIPDVMYQLAHLKYITLSFGLAVLSKDFSKLWNIQTLIIDTTSPSRTLEIKANIWKFLQLRHIKTNVPATLPNIEKDSEGGDKIQTLGVISPLSCTEQVFDRIRNVKKLGIRGKLDLLLNSKSTVSFKSLEKLNNLEKLKLYNDAFPSSASENKLPRLPPKDHFPLQLRRVTLVYTYLKWTYMSILGELENLEVLKLKERAFMGTSWNVSDGGFRKLRVLYIGETDLGNWMANNDSSIFFPKLERLELRNCQQLQNIPIKLADVTSFHSLKLHSTKDAVSSAKKIRDRKQKAKEAEQTVVKTRAFNLTIYPSESA